MSITEENGLIYKVFDDIKIYDGTTKLLVESQKIKIKYLKSLSTGKEKIFSALQPSTLTAQGQMSNISFDEKLIINTLSPPKNHILMFGCNFGERFSPTYIPPVVKKTSGRGRKPKEKKESRRKAQGNGKYFSSQITFLIEHPDTHLQYKIKLFRNGVFQVPGIRNPDMLDLIKPIIILRDYLSYNFGENVQVENFMAVMRNYKACLLNKYYHVNLEALEDIIMREKVNLKYEHFINYMLRKISPLYHNKIKDMLGNYNPMNIAEMTYNTDRCFCLIIKFYRPSIIDKHKKITVKLLKKGKINFDGGNSEVEVNELYLWLEYIYSKYKDQILFDIRKIKDDDDDNTSECNEESIYDDDLEQSDDDQLCDKSELISNKQEKSSEILNKNAKRDPRNIIQEALKRKNE